MGSTPTDSVSRKVHFDINRIACAPSQRRQNFRQVFTMRLHGKSKRTIRKKEKGAKANLSRQPLPPLLGGSKEKQPDTEALVLTIPCRVDKPDKTKPLLLVLPCPCGKKRCITTVYQCEDCTRIFHNRRSWDRHKGIDWIVAPWKNKDLCVSGG